MTVIWKYWNTVCVRHTYIKQKNIITILCL